MIATNPAFRRFIESINTDRSWGQVFIERTPNGFRLRHVADREVSWEQLRAVAFPELRKLASYNVAGQFRPLRVAPDLQRGWHTVCRTEEELGRAIQEIYPGSVADWYAAGQLPAPATSYREFTNRQTGMYRITQLLTDAQAACVIRACCHPRFCLKRRLWSVEGLPPDEPQAKSAIPCLEPCAVMLELARKEARIEQEEKSPVQLSPSELETLVTAARFLLEQGGAGERIGNVGSATNPRRVQLVLEKYGGAVDAARNRDEN